ncbi:MAG: hypothetical protein ACRC92_20875 [Peptostreptococcaceae bacterium]
MKKNYIYVVLTRTNSTLSKAIHYVTKDDYTHAAISLDKNLDQMYGFSRKYTRNPFVGVFKKEDVNKGLYSFQKELPGAIIELEVSEKEYKLFNLILDEFIKNSHKYKYNTKGLFYGLLNKKMDSKDKFLCSEFVYYILNKSNIIEWNVSANLVKPIDLLELPGEIVYEGDLKLVKANIEQEEYVVNNIKVS